MFKGASTIMPWTDLSGQVSTGPSFSGAGISVGNLGIGDAVSSALNQYGANSATVEDIKWGMKRFPELKYHISALATFTSFTNQYPWVNKNVLGPGGITVTVDPSMNQDQALITIITDAFKAVSEANLQSGELDRLKSLISESVDPDELSRRVQSDTLLLKQLANKLLSLNNIYSKLYKAALSIITYSCFVADFSEDYAIIKIYSIDELEVEKEKNSVPAAAQLSKQKKWVVKSTGDSLSGRARVITDENSLDDSSIGRIIHYLKIIDMLETSISVERLAKSNSFLVWMVGVDGFPGELVTPWLDVYKQRVMTRLKAGIDNGNIVQSSLSRSLTASHIFVPNYKDSPTDVKKMDLNYRPLLSDIEYWWSKVFMALGIPPYYSMLQKTGTVSKDVTAFHESMMGSKVRMYQSILERLLGNWIDLFLIQVVGEELISKYKVQVYLPTYVSGGEESRSEYMRRVNQLASAFSTLSVSGLPLNPDFAVKLMFPNSDPKEVVDWEVRKLMNPETSGPYDLVQGEDSGQPVSDQAVNGVLDAMMLGVQADRAPTKPALDPALTVSAIPEVE